MSFRGKGAAHGMLLGAAPFSVATNGILNDVFVCFTLNVTPSDRFPDFTTDLAVVYALPPCVPYTCDTSLRCVGTRSLRTHWAFSSPVATRPRLVRSSAGTCPNSGMTPFVRANLL